MPTQAEVAPSPQMVGNAFVEQYYNVLSQSPEMVHKFYHNSGVISRPGSDGAMMSASTLKDIEKMIHSHDYKNCVVQILTTDAQGSLGDGVIVLVTGYFIEKDNNRRKFTQLFFLAPQSSRAAFSVLNDVLRFIDEGETTPVKINDVNDTIPAAPVTPDPDPILASNDATADHLTDSYVEVDIDVTNETSLPLENGKIVSGEKVVSSDHTNLNGGRSFSAAPIHVDASPSNDMVAPVVQDDAPKKSYASIANALNYKKEPFQRALLPKLVENPRATISVVPEASLRQVGVKPVEKNSLAIVNGYSIFVANLPMDATIEQLREAFKKFGPIKPNGIQVRSYKLQKNCFGFVEFESESSMKSAVEASPFKIGDRMANIEEKKANEGGKFTNKKGSHRGDNFRTGGNFNGSRGGYGNQKVYQNGSRQFPKQGNARAEGQVEGGKS